MSSLFSEWPRDSIAQICAPKGQHLFDNSICSKYYSLGPEELTKIFPLSLVKREQYRLEGATTNYTTKDSELRGVARVIKNSKRTVKKALASFLHSRGFLYPVDGKISTSLRLFIDDFAPDIVFSVPAEYALITLTRRIGEELSIPIAVQVFDNWMPTHYKKGIYALYKRSQLKKELQVLFDIAVLRFGISELMCESYQKHYGLPFLPLPVGVDIDRWYKSLEKRAKAVEPYKILYAGSINQQAAFYGLADMSRAAELLNKNSAKVNFFICSPEELTYSQKSMIGGKFTEFSVETNHNKLIERVQSADLLFLPVNFSKKNQEFIKYSLPAKVAAYMASGTPMIVYAPKHYPVSIEARQYGFAEVVNKQEAYELAATMIDLLNDEGRRFAISRLALNHAKEKYDISRMVNEVRQRFCDEIIQS